MTNLSPFLSVVIPCYNAQDTIIETLDCLNEQTFKDFEVIIVNDGSTDSTLKVIEEYNKSSTLDIIIIDINNSGVSVARNSGIDKAEGKYIYFLDADDLVSDLLFSKLYDSCAKIEFDSVCFKSSTDKENLEKRQSFKAKEISQKKMLDHLTFNKKQFHFCTYLYKKSIINQNSIYFAAGCTHGEDWEFATKYLTCCDKVGIINQTLHYYRIIGSSVSRNISFNQINAIKAAERTLEYLKLNGHFYYKTFEKYMLPKAIFSVLHRFAKSGARSFFDEVIAAYKVKSSFYKLLFFNKTDFKTRLGVIVYLLSPTLFYKFLS